VQQRIGLIKTMSYFYLKHFNNVITVRCLNNTQCTAHKNMVHKQCMVHIEHSGDITQHHQRHGILPQDVVD